MRVLWMVLEPARLGTSTKALLSKGDEVRFSSISALEMSIKQMLGHLSVGEAFGEALRAQGLVELEFSAAHAAGLVEFPQLVGHDPFDRALWRRRTSRGHCS